LKYSKQWRPGSARTHWGSLQRSPYSLNGIRGQVKGGMGQGKGRVDKRERGEKAVMGNYKITIIGRSSITINFV